MLVKLTVESKQRTKEIKPALPSPRLKILALASTLHMYTALVEAV